MSERKPYRKPEIKQLELVPEEAVLAGCKATGTGSTSNKNDGTCPNMGWSCVTQGS